MWDRSRSLLGVADNGLIVVTLARVCRAEVEVGGRVSRGQADGLDVLGNGQIVLFLAGIDQAAVAIGGGGQSLQSSAPVRLAQSVRTRPVQGANGLRGVNSSALQLVSETAVHAGQGYGLRVAGVVRDYGMTWREQAPEDSAATTGVQPSRPEASTSSAERPEARAQAAGKAEQDRGRSFAAP